MIGFFHEVDPGKSGGKGRSLVELQGASFPVPPGFILTYDVYRQFKETGQIAGEMKELILTYYEDLSHETGSSMVAVRSSASAEDLENASFAGLYDSFLYVNSGDELIKRIVDCWHSLFSEPAVAYRNRLNIQANDLNMAVIVQTMVDPESAGILFTTQPYKSGQKVMMVESNWGCGETVVSGKATPDYFVISKDGTYTILEKTPGEKEVVLQGGKLQSPARHTSKKPPGKFSITDNQLKRLCQLGDKIEHHFGNPQDIEWALTDDRKILILQSRPITAQS